MSRRPALVGAFLLVVSACGGSASDPTAAPVSTVAAITEPPATPVVTTTVAPTTTTVATTTSGATTTAAPTTTTPATTTTLAADTGVWARTTAAADGTVLVSSSHTSGVTDRFGPGVYLVDFDFDVRSCGWSATLNDAGDGHLSVATISTEIRDTLGDGNWTGVVVRTFDAAGSPVDLTGADGFAAHVDC